MKNLSIVLSTLSFVGVVVLLVLHFTASSGKNVEINSKDVNNESDTLVVEKVDLNASNIAYINVQRINEEYGYYQDIAEELKSKQKRAENEYMAKAQTFQKEYEEYMKKAQMGSFLSAESQQQQEMELMQKQESLRVLEQDLSMKLQNDLQKLDAQATDTIMNYLKKFNLDANYDMILNSVMILDKGKTVDITDTVLSLLNQKYQEHLNKKAIKK
ncbi:MAG: OmpH family outer membrane protein [Bacteroidales bacterium]|nr:OmpH family outer membrane protein [Bacteroidales bacterium]